MILSAENLSKTYRHGPHRVDAVRGLSLEVAPGEILCLFGRSGSGKTTLLNLLGGLDGPDSGTVTIDGVVMDRLTSRERAIFRRRKIGFVFQNFNLIPYLTALENVTLPLRYEGIPRVQRRERAMKILEDLGLGDRADFPGDRLSGGQVQRVAFARASVMKPAVILADEPTGQLDSATGEELAKMISEMNRRDGIAFIIATHDEAIARISQRVIWILDGRVTGEKEPE